ncbi:MAG: amino acid permease [Bacteroidia bacterium]
MANSSSSIDRLLENSHNSELKKTLGAWNLIALGIGAIIGTGIFVLTGTAAANYAGPAIVLSFIFSGIACAFAALCYAEFASMLPIAGSAYTYAFATMGQFVAWIIGWDLILEYLFASSTVAVGWSGYFVSLMYDFGWVISPEYIASPGTDLILIPKHLQQIAHGWQPVTENLLANITKVGGDAATFPRAVSQFNLPAVCIIGLITMLLIRGIKESTSVNNVIVIVKVAVVILFIIFGFMYIDADNWVPFIPENTGTFGEFGWSGILRGAGVIFFAYIGFDAVSTAAQEAKNPKKHMPIGILGSLVICTILYILVALAMTGIVKYTDLNVPAPIAVAVDKMGPGMAWLAFLTKIGAIAGLTSVMLVMLLGQPRIFYSMSKDGLLPKSFSKVHSKFKTPHITTIVCGIVAMIIAGLVPINILGELVSIGTLFAFIIVCAGVLILRKTRPDIPRAFKTPWVPFVPIMGVLTALAQMIALPFDTWLRLIVWMVIGLLIYFLYGRNNAKKMNQGINLEDKVDSIPPNRLQ